MSLRASFGAVPRLLALAAVCAAVPAAGQSVVPAAPVPASIAPPPVAPVKPAQNTYFGTTLTDPYQWMENLDAPETQAWLKGQAVYARAVLDALPGRAALLARIQTLDNAGVRVGAVTYAGGRYFYEKTTPRSNNRRLYARDGLHGREHLLLDPETLTRKGVHYSLDTFAPSLDGQYVAYAVSPGGSENSVIHVLTTATAAPLPDAIDRAEFPSITWSASNRAFFYRRFPILPPHAAPDLKDTMGRVYLHTLGGDPNKEQPIFGYGVSKSIFTTLADDFGMQYSPASPYVFAIVEHGVMPEISLYAAPLAAVNGPQTPWKKIVDAGADVTQFDARGDTLYLLTHKGASRYKVVRVSIAHPDFAHAPVVVPPGSQVVESIGVARDALYVRLLDSGIGRVARVPFAGGAAQPVALPLAGRAEMATDPRLPGALVQLTGWTHSARWYRYNPVSRTLTDTGLQPPSPVDFSQVASVEVKAKAADGTLVPLSIVFPKAMKRDGSHPTLLEGYGAYGYNLDPDFDPKTLAWLERGGVLAYAHVRGGGENGEDWHRAGQKLNKPNSWHDFDACAQYLIAHGYTKSARLAGTGTSAGGDMINPAYVERPNLLAAAISNVGDTDAVRFELMPGGPANIPEFGTSTTPDGFKALYAMDAYQHVRDGVKYPAVLLTTGINDPRVAPWEPAKMAARLQAVAASVPGAKPVLLRVDYDAGHAGIDATKSQNDALVADMFSFLLWQLGDPQFQPTP